MRVTRGETLTVGELYSILGQLLAEGHADLPVRLIVNGGIAYCAPDAWIEPHQGGTDRPALCIGYVPR